MATKIKKKYNISDETNQFINRLDSLETSIGLVMYGMITSFNKLNDVFGKYLKKHGKLAKKTKTYSRYSIRAKYINKADELKNEVEKLKIGSEIIPCNFIMSLVCEYDYFLGSLIRCLYFLKPEVFDFPEKTITLSELNNLGSISDARKFLLEKEIENILRNSHVEQFKWLENKFSTPLNKDLGIWPVFVELTERRNLFVHSNGVVSKQYLDVCRRNGVEIKNIKIGNKLNVTPEYFRAANECVYEIGVKVAQVLWRKVQSKNIARVDENLGEITYNLILHERYKLAIELLKFATETIKKHSDEKMKRIFVLNLAQAYKWSGDNKKCLLIVDSYDWSSSGYDFKLAVSVLHDKFKEASEFMIKIGKKGGVKEHDYVEWPIFKEFRKSKHFTKVYKKIFRKDFSSNEAIISKKRIAKK